MPTDEDWLKGFKCIQCHACCRQNGYVRLRPEEPDAIAAFLGMDVKAFIETYTYLTRDRQALSLIDQDNGACIFLDLNQGCRIHPAKPRQCRDFPFIWKFSDFNRICGWARQRAGKPRDFETP